MGLEHPTITRTRSDGYPYSERRQMVWKDGQSNEVYPGDEIILFEDEFYLVEELPATAIEILERHGGRYKIAK